VQSNFVVKKVRAPGEVRNIRRIADLSSGRFDRCFQIKDVLGIVGDVETFQKLKIFLMKGLPRMMFFLILNVSSDGI
jgi:hypothetical protein